jgi:hypothetical protein
MTAVGFNELEAKTSFDFFPKNKLLTFVPNGGE